MALLSLIFGEKQKARIGVVELDAALSETHYKIDYAGPGAIFNGWGTNHGDRINTFAWGDYVPLVLDDEDVEVPLVESTDALARATIAIARGEAPLPSRQEQG